MNHQTIEAREFLVQAREALRHGDKASARQLGEKAALLTPELEDAWLVLAASDPDPEDALAYARKALELNPQSQRAQRAVEWATTRFEQVEALKQRTPVSPPILARPVDAVSALPKKQSSQTVAATPTAKSGGRKWLMPALLIGGACLLLCILAVYALTSPLFGSFTRNLGVPAIPQEELWAPVDMVKPEETPVDSNEPVVQLAATATSVPTDVPPTSAPTEAPAQAPTEPPTQAPTFEETVIPLPTETPGTMVMEIVEDTPVSEPIPSEPALSVGNGVRWIDVDLTNQMVYAYEGDVVVNSFLVSTGTWLTPTVTGKHKIYVKVRMQDMSGPGYHLRDVPYVMFFYGDYGLHGTYWHNNFGTPMSRGCVNLTIDDAAWLFNWASVGTIVNVHY
jgi:lipoprotein-anchoring transpeptidase ErfK/SrfK